MLLTGKTYTVYWMPLAMTCLIIVYTTVEILMHLHYNER